MLSSRATTFSLFQLAKSLRTFSTADTQRLRQLMENAAPEVHNICTIKCGELRSRIGHRSIQTTTVNFAKGKAKTNASKKKAAKQQNMPSSLEEVVDMNKLKEDFAKTIDELRQEFASQLAIRTNSASFTNLPIKLDTDDSVNLQYIGQVSMKSANMVHVNLASNPQYVATVRTALENSSLNVNPRIDGSSIFIEIPKVTREHRENLSKSAKVLADKYKVKIREVQNARLKSVKAASKGSFSTDAVRNLENDIMQLAKVYNKQIEELVKQKQKELLS